MHGGDRRTSYTNAIYQYLFVRIFTGGHHRMLSVRHTSCAAINCDLEGEALQLGAHLAHNFACNAFVEIQQNRLQVSGIQAHKHGLHRVRQRRRAAAAFTLQFKSAEGDVRRLAPRTGPTLLSDMNLETGDSASSSWPEQVNSRRFCLSRCF